MAIILFLSFSLSVALFLSSFSSILCLSILNLFEKVYELFDL